MEFKNVRNAEYEKMIKKVLKKKRGIDPFFKSILPEIFLRRAYELELSKEELKEDLKNFDRNVNSIDYVKEDISWIGLYTAEYKKIQLKRDYFVNLMHQKEENWQKVCERIFEVLSHEVYHAIEDRENNFGLWYTNQCNEIVGNALTEICVEKTACICSLAQEDPEQQKNTTLETVGYSTIIFIVDILAAMYRKPERRFLKSASRSRIDLLTYITSNVPNIYKSLDSFEALETNLDILYNLDYHNDKNINLVDAKNLRRDTVKQIYQIAIDELKQQLEEMPNSQKTGFLMESFRYSREKIENIMNMTLYQYKEWGKIDSSQIEDVLESVKESLQKLDHRIVEEQAMHPPIPSYEFDEYMIKSEYDGGKKWNNDPILKMMREKVLEEFLLSPTIGRKENAIIIANLPNVLEKIKNILKNVIKIPQLSQDRNAFYSQIHSKGAGTFPTIKNTLKKYEIRDNTFNHIQGKKEANDDKKLTQDTNNKKRKEHEEHE